jgi:hypothetical protein
MGNPSYLRFIPTSVSKTPINWTNVPEASKKALTQSYAYNWEKDVPKRLPKTIAGLAKLFNETKFVGYFTSDILTALMDISEFGLKAANPTGQSLAQVGPRFYMTYVDQVWFILFQPGKRDCILGCSNHFIRKDDFAQKEADDSEVEIAKEFDPKLVQEVSRGMGRLVKHTGKLGGWKASMVQSELETSQYADAVMQLPGSHPAHRAFMDAMFHGLFKPNQ